jgi:hypothetical protein
VGWPVDGSGGTPWHLPQAASPAPTFVHVGAVLFAAPGSVEPWQYTAPHVGVCGFQFGFAPPAFATPPKGTSTEPSRWSGSVKTCTVS